MPLKHWFYFQLAEYKRIIEPQKYIFVIIN